MDSNAIWVSVVDESGKKLESYGWIEYPAELRSGDVIDLNVDGKARTFSVLDVQAGEGQSRFVHVVELAWPSLAVAPA